MPTETGKPGNSSVPQTDASLMIQLLLRCRIAAVLALWAAQGMGQTTTAPAPSENQQRLADDIEQLANKLADVEKQVDVARPSQSQLARVATDVAPLATQAQAMVDRLAPRVTAMKTRIDQLGPKPEKGESPEISQERATLEKSFSDADGLFKRAKVLALKAQQEAAYISKRQRTLFAHSLFQRSTSLLDPPLWFTVVRETPGNMADTGRALRRLLDALEANGTGGTLAFWAIVGGVVLLYWPLTVLGRRLVSHEARIKAPTEWQKITSALGTSLRIAGLMIAVMYAVVYVFSFIDVADEQIVPLYGALQWCVIRIAVAAGLSRGLLAPRRSKWRLVNLDDTTAGKLVRIAIGVAIVVSVGHLIEALNDVIGASLDFSLAVKGVGALLVALGLAAALADLGDDPAADNPEADVADASSPTQRRDIYGFIRGSAWTLILVIAAAVLVGYVAFASFLVEQLTLIAAVGTTLFMLIRLVDEACVLGLQPTSRLGRNLLYTVGMRRETLEQLPVVLSGFGRLVLFGVALLIVSAPWGMQSTDVSSNLNAVFFGFKVGDFTISLASIAIAIVSFLVVLAVTRGVQNWLEDRYLPTTRLDSGLRNSIKTSLGYVGFIIAVAVGAGNIGLDFQKLAIVAGALSVGIGFGLQSIVNNFVSGLILLWERAVRVGDWVVVGAEQGYVRKINVRSTEIETFDRAAVIVPNSNLVSGVVKNLMRADRVGRLQIELTVHATADPEKVREVLMQIAGENEAVVSLPSPQVRFTNLTASAMTFDLFCYVADVESSLRTKSDLYFEICRQFRAHKFFDGPAPDPTAINILGLDRLEELLKSRDIRPIEAETTRPRKLG